MKMVSAAKLRKAQETIIQMRPFETRLKNMTDGVVSSAGGGAGVFAKSHPEGKVWIVAITSNRGLCGAFNSNVYKTVNALIRENSSAMTNKNNVELACIGKKAMDYFKKSSIPVTISNREVFDNLNYAAAAAIAEEIMINYAKGDVNRVVVVYNRFKNAATQILSTEQLLPFTLPSPSPVKSEKTKIRKDYIYEPEQEEILKKLIPFSVKVRIYRMLLDSSAAEHGARMTAMHKATDNAQALLKSLRLSYNKARQAAITKEILEIVGGAEAIKN